MRGSDKTSGSLFSYIDLEARVPQSHPLQVIRGIVNEVLASLDAEFERLYEGRGRESIAPERPLRASLLQVFYSVRSERQLVEQIDYNLLFRWFVGLGIDDVVWDHSTFSKNRDRLLEAEVAAKFLEAVLRHKKVKHFLSEDHFSVMLEACLRHDGTLVEVWASMKSFRAKDGSREQPAPPTGEGSHKSRNAEVDFHGHKRRNDTHESVTDPDARLYKKGKGQPAKLCFMGHALIENRHGLVVGADASMATGTAERETALDRIGHQTSGHLRRVTLGGDKGYDVASFVSDLRQFAITPHVAAKDKGSAIDARTRRHAGYAVSQKKRKLVEEAFGWAKTIAGLAKVKVRGLPRVRYVFTFAMATYNLIRMPKLLEPA